MRKFSLSLQFILVTLIIFFLTMSPLVLALTQLNTFVQTEIDNDLQSLGLDFIKAADGQTPLLENIDWPDNTQRYVVGSHFYSVLNPSGAVVQQSANLSEPMIPLTPNYETPEPVFETFETEDGQQLRILVLPLSQNPDDPQLVGYLQIGRIVDDFNIFSRLSLISVFLALGSISAFVLGLTIAIPRVLRPFNDIIIETENISSSNDLSYRFTIDNSNDTVSQLKQSMNNLFTKLQDLFGTQQRLLADVSHELRTPLTAIRGNVDLMRRMGVGDSESLTAIEADTVRMSRLVNDLLSLARAEVGGLPIRREPLVLDRLFMEAYESMLVVDSPVRVILLDAQPARVLGDEDRLKQLVLNLMTNAVKYTNAGGTVMVSLLTNEEENEAIIRIKDNGVGIPAEDLPHIFDRFYRVSKARTRERGGAGLGLAIAHSIVAAHHGTISAESEVGVGSTFIVKLPTIQH